MNKNIKGLTNEEVKKSRNIYGYNILSKKNKRSFFKLIFESLNDPIIKILIIALAIKIVFLFNDSNIYETLGIAVAVFLAAFVSAISEYSSEKAFDRLNSENSGVKVKVYRNFKKETIDISDVVVGDIVSLEQGDKVPADGIMIEGDIHVDESKLTGETNEKHKKKDEIIYMGSIVTEGSCIMKVDNIGNRTYYGKIASDIQEIKTESPLKLRLKDLASTVSKLGYICAFIIFISYLFNALVINNNFNFDKVFNLDYLFPHIIYALTLSVAVIVMAVPDSL